jgi:hypothetical protein
MRRLASRSLGGARRMIPIRIATAAPAAHKNAGPKPISTWSFLAEAKAKQTRRCGAMICTTFAPTIEESSQPARNPVKAAAAGREVRATAKAVAVVKTGAAAPNSWAEEKPWSRVTATAKAASRAAHPHHFTSAPPGSGPPIP